MSLLECRVIEIVNKQLFGVFQKAAVARFINADEDFLFPAISNKLIASDCLLRFAFLLP
jgi:hypothetical protein